MSTTTSENSITEQIETRLPDLIISDNLMRINHATICTSCRKEFSSQMGDTCPFCGYPVYTLGYRVEAIDAAAEIYRKNAGLSSCEKITKTGELYEMGTFRAERIVWRVLAIEEGEALLISEKGLDCRAYHYTNTEISWKESRIRSWLNNIFYNTSFSPEERKQILLNEVEELTGELEELTGETDEEDGEEKLEDYIFLLGLEELNRYFPSIEERTCQPTEYAAQKEIDRDEYTGCCRWWLRSMSRYPDRAESVSPAGYVGISRNDKKPVNTDTIAVRPAMWIRLEASENEEE